MNLSKKTRASALVLLSGVGLLAVPACGSDGAAATTAANGGSSGSASGGKAGSSGGTSGGAAGAAGGKAGTGGSSAGKSGSAGAAGTAGAAGASQNGPGSACTTDQDCGLGNAETTPASCAEAYCKVSVCALRAIDADGDGFRTKKCKLVSDGTFVIDLGADCDDTSKDTNPKGWDGPAGDGNPDRCNDGVDQDCSGVDGDAVLANGASCSCTPGDTEKCGQTAGGSPIDYPGGKPVVGSECKLGDRTCVADLLSGGGKWGPCTGAVGPTLEICDGATPKDQDCDGEADEADADGKLEWVYDADGDSSRASLPNGDPTKPPIPFASIFACAKPTGTPPECTAAYCGARPIAECCPPDKWRPISSVTSVDCDDGDNAVFPGAPERCAVTSGPNAKNKDDNCNGQVDELPAVGTLLWFLDQDDDEFGDSKTVPKTSCGAPGPGWKTGIVNTDCDDTTSAISPGVAENCSTLVDDNCNGSKTDGCACTAADGPQDCGKPGECVYLPGGSACKNGVYENCPAPIDKQEYCADADADAACVLTSCGQYCPSVLGNGGPSIPMGYTKRDTCGTVADCNDTSKLQDPALEERCGDMVDTDCDGSTDNGFFLGEACDVGPTGACKGGGTNVCDGPEKHRCQANPGIPSSAFHLEAAPNGSFDWDCNGILETQVVKPMKTALGCTGRSIVMGPAPAAAFCIDNHKVKNDPYSWKAAPATCVHTAVGPGESVPTCAQLNVNSNCTAHYYFTGCRDKVTGKVNPLDFEWSCENPCGKEILALDCEVKNGACVDRVVSPATGCFNEPTIECH